MKCECTRGPQNLKMGPPHDAYKKFIGFLVDVSKDWCEDFQIIIARDPRKANKKSLDSPRGYYNLFQVFGMKEGEITSWLVTRDEHAKGKYDKVITKM